MKIGWLVVLMMSVVSIWADDLEPHVSVPRDVIHVATSLDHLTVLEFGEPVTMAAAGSSAFQIERHEDKVFIKPLKTGASTDLFVWTSSRRFVYELESPGEVKDMSFAIDSRVLPPKPTTSSNEKIQEIADMSLMRALLGAERVDSSGIKNDKGRVIARIEQVFQSKNTVYIHYSIRNLSTRPYRVVAPTVSQALAPRTKISVTSLEHMQLDGQLLRKLGKLMETFITPAQAETQEEDVRPGEETQGVVAIRGQVASPVILKLTFGADRSDPIQATMVF